MATSADETQAQVCVVIVPFPAQGHLNQLLHLSALISSHSHDKITVYFVGPTAHNHQARSRADALDPSDVSRILFHDIPTPPSEDTNSGELLAGLRPAISTAIGLREPFASFLGGVATRFRRVVIIHDTSMAYVVQDLRSFPNVESYSFISTSAYTFGSFVYQGLGKPFPVKQNLPPLEGSMPDDVMRLMFSLCEPSDLKSGDIYNTCRSIESSYLGLLETEEIVGSKKSWAIGPILPAKLPSSGPRHECLEWLDQQDMNSVIYVAFGTTNSLSDEQVKELALGLEQCKVKFLWVLRNADGSKIRAALPPGFEGRIRGMGMVVRDWAPQPHILSHPSTGGFVSHCGWNSCIESIVTGVPIAAWPMHSDQPRNAVLVVDVLKMGIVMREWGRRNELVKASTVESVVRKMMGPEEGDELRKRAKEQSRTVQTAVRPGGVSRLDLDSLIAHITREI